MRCTERCRSVLLILLILTLIRFMFNSINSKMQNILNNVVGLVLTVPAFGLNLKAWLEGAENVNMFLTITISVLAIIWSTMKIYDQYLITKKRKAENEV